MNKAKLGLLRPAGPLHALTQLCGTRMMKIKTNEYFRQVTVLLRSVN
jgi:hypothetical protein